jgi:hypothetical protein
MVVRNFLVGTLLRETCWLRVRRMKSSRLVVRIKGEEGSVIWDLRTRKILSWFVWILKICTLQALSVTLDSNIIEMFLVFQVVFGVDVGVSDKGDVFLCR